MPPLAAAVEILASPVAYTRMPHASARPTLGPVAAGPTATGPFMSMVIPAVTGPWPSAHPLRSAAHVKVSIERFSITGPPYGGDARSAPAAGYAKARTEPSGFAGAWVARAAVICCHLQRGVSHSHRSHHAHATGAGCNPGARARRLRGGSVVPGVAGRSRRSARERARHRAVLQQVDAGLRLHADVSAGGATA